MTTQPPVCEGSTCLGLGSWSASGPAWKWRSVGAVLATWTAMAIWTDAEAIGADYFVQRFATDAINSRVLTLIGTQTRQAVRRTSKGLVIKLPLPNGPRDPQIGVATKFSVAGDFEVTVGYELIQVDQPDEGYGAGLALFLDKGGTKERAILARRRLPDGRSILRANLIRPEGKKTKYDHKNIVVQANRGRLRFVRTGSTLRYLFADGDSEQFREVRTIEFGTAPVRVRVCASTGRSTKPLVVCLTELSIRAEELPYGLPAPQRRRIWGVWGMFLVLAAVVLLAFGSWYWWSRRTRSKTLFGT